MSRFTPWFLWLLCLCAVPVLCAEEASVGQILVAGAEYGYYAPEIHELYLRVPIKLAPLGEKEDFDPERVTIDGQPVSYTFWYADGHTIDYGSERNASKKRLQAFVPFCWRAGEQHEVAVRFAYAGKTYELKETIPTPATGGAFTPATGGDQAFLVREEIGLARRQEPVEFDVTVPAALFPDPETTIRATVMRQPGVFEEIPCQTYDAEAFGRLVRFRTAVQLDMAPKAQAVVHLWSCPPRTEALPAGVALTGSALGGVVTSPQFRIELDAQSGQLYRWEDRTLRHQFAYIDPRPGVTGNAAVIHRTPDMYKPGAPWSHAYDWKTPAFRQLTGPVFVETLRWGEMPDLTQIFARVAYRFYAGRPEVRTASSMRVNKDVMTMGLRVGGMIFGVDEFTHAAWPLQDGTLQRVAVWDALGNDMGAPPASRFPVETPWVAFYNEKEHVGFAMLTPKLAYFTDGTGHPNQSQAKAYASLYRGCGVYTVRSVTQTYCADVRTYTTPLHAGDTLYEEAVYLPFGFTKVDDKQFAPVTRLYKELSNPLVVQP